MRGPHPHYIPQPPVAPQSCYCCLSISAHANQLHHHSLLPPSDLRRSIDHGCQLVLRQHGDLHGILGWKGLIFKDEGRLNCANFFEKNLLITIFLSHLLLSEVNFPEAMVFVSACPLDLLTQLCWSSHQLCHQGTSYWYWQRSTMEAPLATDDLSSQVMPLLHLRSQQVQPQSHCLDWGHCCLQRLNRLWENSHQICHCCFLRCKLACPLYWQAEWVRFLAGSRSFHTSILVLNPWLYYIDTTY